MGSCRRQERGRADVDLVQFVRLAMLDVLVCVKLPETPGSPTGDPDSIMARVKGTLPVDRDCELRRLVEEDEHY